MKKLIYILMILFCGIFVSCDNDDIYQDIVIINNSYNTINDSTKTQKSNTPKSATISFGVPDVQDGNK